MQKLLPKLAALLLALCVLVPLEPHTRAADVDMLVVIVSNSTQIANISLATLRQAFRGERAEYGDGKRLLPFNHPVDARERVVFDRAVLGLEPDEVGRFWIQSRIRDEGLPPRVLPSVELGLRVVAKFPGAITYMRSSMVNASVRVLSVDGKAPGAPGYLFPRM